MNKSLLEIQITIEPPNKTWYSGLVGKKFGAIDDGDTFQIVIGAHPPGGGWYLVRKEHAIVLDSSENYSDTFPYNKL